MCEGTSVKSAPIPGNPRLCVVVMLSLHLLGFDGVEKCACVEKAMGGCLNCGACVGMCGDVNGGDVVCVVMVNCRACDGVCGDEL